jgi:hypothetical protein
MFVSQWKNRTKQNPNPNLVVDIEYMTVRSWMTPCMRLYGLQHDTKANGPKDGGAVS